MNQLVKLAAAAALGALASGSIVYAQGTMAGPPKARVALYRAAPGQQVALLRWLAQEDRAAQAAGVPTGQLYAHTDGDSWDYMVIDPVTTPAQDAAMNAAARKMGLPVDAGQALDLRKYIAMHTDTYTIGPVSAAQYLALAGQ
jgi:hypothetical protein